MPNWNITDVRVVGPEDQIDKLYKTICSLQDSKEPSVQNGFGNTWYGCLVNELGENWENVYCRGDWNDVEKVNPNTLKWWDETAWAPLLEVFDVIEKHFPGLKVYWLAEEPGMNYYESNDIEHMFFNTMFILYYDDCEQTEYFETEEELLEFVRSYLEDRDMKPIKPIESLEELDQIVEDRDDLYYYPFEYKEYGLNKD